MANRLDEFGERTSILGAIERRLDIGYGPRAADEDVRVLLGRLRTLAAENQMFRAALGVIGERDLAVLQVRVRDVAERLQLAAHLATVKAQLGRLVGAVETHRRVIHKMAEAARTMVPPVDAGIAPEDEALYAALPPKDLG